MIPSPPRTREGEGASLRYSACDEDPEIGRMFNQALERNGIQHWVRH